MKNSQFNIFANLENGNYLIYNTYTTSIVELDKSTYNEIFEKNNFKNVNVPKLFDMGFLVDDEENEEKNVTELREELILGQRGFRAITILTTTACNARCYYCFEKGIKSYTLTYEICDKIIDFIINNCNSNKLTISWFGGEPLLAFDKIKYILDGLKQSEICVSSSVTTNGSLIDAGKVKYMRENNFTRVQITVDSIGDDYNRIKNYNSISDAYSLILANIERLLQNQIPVVLRVNYKISELNKAKLIFNTLKKRFDIYGNLVYIYLAPLTLGDTPFDGNLQYKNNKEKEFLEMIKFVNSTEYKMNMQSLGEIDSSNELLAKYMLLPIGIPCEMSRHDRVVIDADGTLYKCHRLVGRKEFACGNVYDGIDESTDIFKEFNNIQIKKEECKKCAYLPLCQEGCIANKHLYKSLKSCSPIKSIGEELLKLYYEEYMTQTIRMIENK